MSSFVSFFCGLAFAGAMSPSAFAIDLQPGEVRSLPPGTTFVQTGIVLSRLDGLVSDGHELPGDREIEVTTSYLRLGQFFEVFDLPAAAYVQGAVGKTELGGMLAPLDGDTGLDDTAFLLAIWPYANDNTHTYWAVGAYAFLPTGSYTNELGPLSVGKNRSAGAVQTALQTALTDNIGFMTAFDVIWFGTNDDFTDDHLELDQKPLATAQAALTYQFTPVYSLSAAYFYSFGGEYVIDGADQNNDNSTHRYQLSASAQYPFGRFTLQYGADLRRKNGYLEDGRSILRFSRSF